MTALRFPQLHLDLRVEDEAQALRDFDAVLAWRSGWVAALERGGLVLVPKLRQHLDGLCGRGTDGAQSPLLFADGIGRDWATSEPPVRPLVAAFLWRAGVERFFSEPWSAQAPYGLNERRLVLASLMPEGTTRETHCAFCLLPLATNGGADHDAACAVRFLLLHSKQGAGLGADSEELIERAQAELRATGKRGWITLAWSFQSPLPVSGMESSLQISKAWVRARIDPRPAIARREALAGEHVAELQFAWAGAERNPRKLMFELEIAKYRLLHVALPNLQATAVRPATVDEVPFSDSAWRLVGAPETAAMARACPECGARMHGTGELLFDRTEWSVAFTCLRQRKRFALWVRDSDKSLQKLITQLTWGVHPATLPRLDREAPERRAAVRARFPRVQLDLFREDGDQDRRDHQTILAWKAAWWASIATDDSLSQAMRRDLEQLQVDRTKPGRLDPVPRAVELHERSLIDAFLWRAAVEQLLAAPPDPAHPHSEAERWRVRESLMPLGTTRETHCALCLMPQDPRAAAAHEATCAVRFLWQQKGGFEAWMKGTPTEEWALADRRGWTTLAWSFKSRLRFAETQAVLQMPRAWTSYRVHPRTADAASDAGIEHIAELQFAFARPKRGAKVESTALCELEIAKYRVLHVFLRDLEAVDVRQIQVEEVPGERASHRVLLAPETAALEHACAECGAKMRGTGELIWNSSGWRIAFLCPSQHLIVPIWTAEYEPLIKSLSRCVHPATLPTLEASKRVRSPHDAPPFPDTQLDLLVDDEELATRDWEAIVAWRSKWATSLKANPAASKGLLIDLGLDDGSHGERLTIAGTMTAMAPDPDGKPYPHAFIHALLWRAAIERFCADRASSVAPRSGVRSEIDDRQCAREGLMPAGKTRETHCALCLTPLGAGGASVHEPSCAVRFLWAHKSGLDGAFRRHGVPEDVKLAQERGWTTLAWSFNSPLALAEAEAPLQLPTAEARCRIYPRPAGEGRESGAHIVELQFAFRRRDSPAANCPFATANMFELEIAKYRVLHGVLPALSATDVSVARVEEVPRNDSTYRVLVAPATEGLERRCPECDRIVTMKATGDLYWNRTGWAIAFLCPIHDEIFPVRASEQLELLNKLTWGVHPATLPGNRELARRGG